MALSSDGYRNLDKQSGRRRGFVCVHVSGHFLLGWHPRCTAVLLLLEVSLSFSSNFDITLKTIAENWL